MKSLAELASKLSASGLPASVSECVGKSAKYALRIGETTFLASSVSDARRILALAETVRAALAPAAPAKA